MLFELIQYTSAEILVLTISFRHFCLFVLN